MAFYAPLEGNWASLSSVRGSIIMIDFSEAQPFGEFRMAILLCVSCPTSSSPCAMGAQARSA